MNEHMVGNTFWRLRKEYVRTPEMRRAASDRKLGARNPAWRGGISPISQRVRRSLEYREWRTAVFDRDNYTCVTCGARNGNGKAVYLQADHIKPFALFPKLRFEVENGRTLCLDCHKATPTFGFKAADYGDARRYI